MQSVTVEYAVVKLLCRPHMQWDTHTHIHHSSGSNSIISHLSSEMRNEYTSDYWKVLQAQAHALQIANASHSLLSTLQNGLPIKHTLLLVHHTPSPFCRDVPKGSVCLLNVFLNSFPVLFSTSDAPGFLLKSTGNAYASWHRSEGSGRPWNVLSVPLESKAYP
jgi:hypothetical protein